MNCLHHSIVLAVQNYDDHPPFDPPYDIEKHLVNNGNNSLRTDEKNAIEKAEGERRDSSKAYGEPGGPDNKGRPALIACLLSQKGKSHRTTLWKLTLAEHLMRVWSLRTGAVY